jgi:hypothetical protein
MARIFAWRSPQRTLVRRRDSSNPLNERSTSCWEAWLTTMKRPVLVALTVLGLAGCASTHRSDTSLKIGGDPLHPAVPALSEDVVGAIQSRELNSVIRGR